MMSQPNLEVPMPEVKARQKRRDLDEADAITSRPWQGQGNNYEAEAPKR